MKSPGTAAGVKNGRIVSDSEMRTCTSPYEIGANTSVRTTYTAAIAAARVINAGLDSFIFSLLSFILREDGFELAERTHSDISEDGPELAQHPSR